MTWNRRRFLGTSALAGAGLAAGAVTGCDTAPGGGARGPGAGPAGALTWWDHQNQLEPAKQRIFEQYARAEGGVPVSYTYNNPAKLGQALQLAKQSNQLPDIHSNAGLEVPTTQLIEGGWVGPLDLDDAALGRLEGSLVEGIHVFDGRVYSFPIFSHQSHSAVFWFNTELATRAGVDPEAPPASYDAFRAAARAVRDSSGGKSAGWVWNIGMVPRIAEQVSYLAQAAGFEGSGGSLFRTGEYAFDSEPFLTAIDFLLSLQRDQLLAAGSQTWIDDVARSRWMTGAGGWYLDGPWCPGVALKDNAGFAEKLGVGPILTPGGDAPATYRGLPGGEYWLTPTSTMAAQANALLGDWFTTEDYSVAVADTMSQPPRDLAAVDRSSAHPAYKKLVGLYAEQVFLAPDPVVRNPAVTQVAAETAPIKPGLGDIVQGAFSGDVTDVRAALTELTSKSNAERERAVTAAAAAGAEVSMDDYVFADWKPRADYRPAG